jgi:hypothetical protein
MGRHTPRQLQRSDDHSGCVALSLREHQKHPMGWLIRLVGCLKRRRERPGPVASWVAHRAVASIGTVLISQRFNQAAVRARGSCVNTAKPDELQPQPCRCCLFVAPSVAGSLAATESAQRAPSSPPSYCSRALVQASCQGASAGVPPAGPTPHRPSDSLVHLAAPGVAYAGDRRLLRRACGGASTQGRGRSAARASRAARQPRPNGCTVPAQLDGGCWDPRSACDQGAISPGARAERRDSKQSRADRSTFSNNVRSLPPSAEGAGAPCRRGGRGRRGFGPRDSLEQGGIK